MSESLSSCTLLINKHFQLDEEELAGCNASIEALEQSLAVIINNLINQDLSRLLNAFYKIDMDETVFKRILSSEAPDQISLTLAKEVIKRELQKVATREKYKSS